MDLKQKEEDNEGENRTKMNDINVNQLSPSQKKGMEIEKLAQQNKVQTADEANRDDADDGSGERIAFNSESYVQLLEEKRLKLKKLLDGNDSELSQVDKQLKEESKKLNDKRVEIAKRIIDLQKSHEEKRKQDSDFEKELLLLNKQAMFSQVTNLMRTQVDNRSKYEKAESDQLLLMNKVDMIRQEIINRSKEEQSKEHDLYSTYYPLAKVLDGSTETSHFIHESVKNNSGYDTHKFSREFQYCLNDIHEKNIQRIYDDRNELKKNRYELEAAIQKINDKLLKMSEKVVPNVSLNDTMMIAEEMSPTVRSNIQSLESRIKDIQNELKWLHHEPDTEGWKNFYENIEKTKSERDQIELELIAAQQLIDTMKVRNDLVADDVKQEVKEVLLAEIFRKVMDESVGHLIHQVVEDVVTSRKIADKHLDGIFSFACSGEYEDHVKRLSTTGRGGLLKGCFHSLSDDMHMAKKAILQTNAGHFVLKTQQAIHSWQKLSSASNFNRETKHLQERLLLREAIWRTHKKDSKGALEKVESDFWQQKKFAQIEPKLVTIPPEVGYPNFVRTLSRPSKSLSLVFIGAKNGRFAVWSAPWKSATEDHEQNHPILIAVSPMLPSREECKIIDVKDSTTIGSSLILTLDEKHIIRMWSLSPVNRVKSHTISLFPQKMEAFSPIIPSCLIYLDPIEFNLPDPSVLAEKSTVIEKEPIVGPQKGVFPQCVHFFPSFTISARNSSVIVGLQSGDLVKYNLDYKEKYLEAPLVFPKRFVSVEYMHSIHKLHVRTEVTSKDHMVQAVEDTTKTGNRVNREFFHFHKAPVIFIGVLRNTTNMLISIDIEGNAAIWNYTPEHFSTIGWFKPKKTFHLDLKWRSGIAVSSSVQIEQIPSPSIWNELKLLLRYRKSPTELYECYTPYWVSSPTDNSTGYDVYYECLMSLEEDAPKARGELDTNGNIWSAYRLHSNLHPATVVNVKMTPDGDELVFLTTYNTSSKDILYRRLTYDFSSIASAPLTIPSRVETLNESAIKEGRRRRNSVVTSNTTTNHEEARGQGSKLANVNYEEKTFFVLSCLYLNKLKFHSPVCIFELERDEIVLDFHVGTVSRATLTRTAFVQTNTSIRLYSLETSQEIKVKHFPMKITNPVNNFTPTLSGLCHHHQILALGTSSDTRIAIYQLTTSSATTEETSNVLTLTSKIKKAFSRDPMQVVKSVFEAFVPMKRKEQAQKQQLEEPSNRLILGLINDFIAEIFIKVNAAIDEIELKQEVKGFVSEVYDDKLGTIYPTRWPAAQNSSNKHERKKLVNPLIRSVKQDQDYYEMYDGEYEEEPSMNPLKLTSGDPMSMRRYVSVPAESKAPSIYSDGNKRDEENKSNLSSQSSRKVLTTTSKQQDDNPEVNSENYDDLNEEKKEEQQDNPDDKLSDDENKSSEENKNDADDEANQQLEEKQLEEDEPSEDKLDMLADDKQSQDELRPVEEKKRARPAPLRTATSELILL